MEHHNFNMNVGHWPYTVASVALSDSAIHSLSGQYYCNHILFEKTKNQSRMSAGLVEDLIEALACVTCRLDWLEGPQRTEKAYTQTGRQALAHAVSAGYEIPEPFKSAIGVLDT